MMSLGRVQLIREILLSSYRSEMLDTEGMQISLQETSAIGNDRSTGREESLHSGKKD
jgi:hypothetical protein